MIKLKLSQKSVTPPANKAYDEEGEEERDAEEEEEEEEQPRPAKRQRMGSSLPKGQGKSKGKGEDKARANTPLSSLGSSIFPAVERKTRGKRRANKLPPYVPPRPVPTMDTVRLATESLAKEQSEPTIVSRTNRDCSTILTPSSSLMLVVQTVFFATANAITVSLVPFAITAIKGAFPTAVSHLHRF
jgi:hypothetical protein